MRCPRCGEKNDEGFKFCRGCGGPLPVADEAEAASALAETTSTTPPESQPPLAPAESEIETIYKLVATAGLLSGRTFTIDAKGLMIGRDPSSCQVVVADDEVSRLHAWVGFNEEGEVVVKDRNSANGTYVNTVRVTERVLRPSDEICVGNERRHLFRMEAIQIDPQAAVVTAQTKAPKPAAPRGSTSVISAKEIAAAVQEEKIEGGTVKMKVTDLLARPHLELIVDKYAVRTLDIPDKGLVVGRDASRCPLTFEHQSVSGVHAEFMPKGDKVLLTDRSTNGTFVNGIRAATSELHDGDYITFGRYSGKSLIFRTGLEPELKVEKIDLTKDLVTIGRDPENDVAINHPLVSKKHAQIIKQDGRVYIVDVGSTNGTFVNGIKIRKHPLQELDRIVVGPIELHFSGASLSHTPTGTVVRLDVRNVSFQVSDVVTGKPKLLLDDLSLVVKPRELIGLLGPSGAGKTTLMNALNGFVKPTGGHVFYNGADLYQNLSSMKSTIGFVPQEDIMHKQLSVRRCLYYAAKLRLPADLSEAEVNKRVDEMLDILKIDPQRWNNPVATLSGGQRKRVSVGIELLPKPGVLFLDEPTAGLDPRTETLMMMLFRQLANQGSTIVITTHMLASFGVLDKVVVMVQGRLAFYGPGTKFLNYFKAEAPPDVYDDLTDNNTIPYSQELKKRYEQSTLFKELIAEPLKSVQAETSKTTQAPAAKAETRSFGLNQFKVLLSRNWDLKFGDRAQTILLFSQAPIVALLVAMMASGSNQIQTIFMAMFAALWFGCSNAVREIVDEQTIYKRERQTGLKIPSYVFSKLFVLSFVALAQCASVLAILMFMPPGHPALSLSPVEILGGLAIMFLVSVNGTLIGLVISSVVKTPEKALTLFPLILIPELLLSGLFLPVQAIHPIIPITMGQLAGGQIFAQPADKALVEQKMHPATPEPAAAQGEAAHQVAGAVAPSKEVQLALQKFTPQPVDGMPKAVELLSDLAISRWGMEALSDLCLHGSHSMQDSAYKIINTVYISFHPDDLEKLEKGLDAPADAFAGGTFPLPSNFWVDKAPYFSVLTGYAALMTLIVLFLMKRKDVA
jgi:ABC-type multidrug transport system ATPase subunit/pSer/pThr/pTyr-binding forkhead associated (FHA) protein